ncbi:9036_t:CDS:2 [Ambispora gerdemannii]|uniref:9036_t:CDS:1 n=1 Tax=Ambispora gerdemannii TaxID=144530 RepID=A0A9N9CXP2_9GLOM|nr:9036_t:CDS:2 [Ambispora gerdemannii]
MYSTSKLRRWALIGLVCLLFLINILAGRTEAAGSTCVVCGAPPPCPQCSQGKICVLDLQTCTSCPTPRCGDIKVGVSNNSFDKSNENSGSNSNAKLIPAVIGGLLGAGLLAAAVFGYMRYKRRRDRGLFFSSTCEKLDGSSDSENVIPIAYIPPVTPTTPTTPRPEPAHARSRLSYLSVGTTPLVTPLASPLPRTYSNEKMVSLSEDDDAFSEVGTVLQATKATPASGTTVVTATRAKPALVRLNTVKSNSHSELRSQAGNHLASTPATPKTGNTLLSVHSSNKSSAPSSPTTFHSISINGNDDEDDLLGDEYFDNNDDDTITMSRNSTILLPQIDVERSSLESSNTVSRTINNNHSENTISSNLVSPFLDPFEGRQSFGLFGSDEVDSSGGATISTASIVGSGGGTSPHLLERESMISSASSNPRSTMMSDEGDGEIMIFWGGEVPNFLENDPSIRNSDNNMMRSNVVSSTSSSSQSSSNNASKDPGTMTTGIK